MRTFLFLTLSMQSYYFHQLSMPLISLLALFSIFSLLLLKYKEEVFIFQVNPTGYILGFYIFLFTWNVFGLLYFGEILDIKRAIGFFIILTAVLFSEKFILNISRYRLIRNYLIIHSSFFYVQFFSHYIFDVQLDFLYFVTGEVQRTLSDNLVFDLSGQFMRPAGLFVEPGTYAAFIAPFIALFSKWYTSSKVNRFIFWMALSSLILSGSTFGMVFAVVIFFSLREIRLIYKVSIIAPTVLWISPYFYYRFFVRSDGNGIGIRGEFVNNFVEYSFASIEGFIFGIKNMVSLVLKVPYNTLAENDGGLLFYLLFSNGLFAGFFILLFLIYMFIKVQYTSKIAFLIILLSKHSIFSPFFPFMLILILRRSYKSKRDNKEINLISSLKK